LSKNSRNKINANDNINPNNAPIAPYCQITGLTGTLGSLPVYHFRAPALITRIIVAGDTFSERVAVSLAHGGLKSSTYLYTSARPP
jgi:hypothetical protein